METSRRRWDPQSSENPDSLSLEETLKCLGLQLTASSSQKIWQSAHVRSHILEAERVSQNLQGQKPPGDDPNRGRHSQKEVGVEDPQGQQI
jgi:hypothetical protein